VTRLVDLTQPWGDRMPTWPQFEPVQVTDITTHHRDGKSTVLVRTNMHTGTHIDAPSHYWTTGKSLGDIPIGDLYGTALVIVGVLLHRRRPLTHSDRRGGAEG